MVIAGDFKVELVDANTKEPFKERSKDGMTYVESKEGVCYFISIQKLGIANIQPLVARCLVDGLRLGWQRNFSVGEVDNVPQYNGSCTFEYEDGTLKREIKNSLVFSKPAMTNGMAIGKIEFQIFAQEEPIYDKTRRSKTSEIDRWSKGVSLSSSVKDDVSIQVCSKIGSTSDAFERIDNGKYTTTYKRGALLQTITLKYCSSPCLVKAGVIAVSPKRSRKDAPAKDVAQSPSSVASQKTEVCHNLSPPVASIAARNKTSAPPGLYSPIAGDSTRLCQLKLVSSKTGPLRRRQLEHEQAIPIEQRKQELPPSKVTKVGVSANNTTQSHARPIPPPGKDYSMAPAMKTYQFRQGPPFVYDYTGGPYPGPSGMHFDLNMTAPPYPPCPSAFWTKFAPLQGPSGNYPPGPPYASFDDGIHFGDPSFADFPQSLLGQGLNGAPKSGPMNHHFGGFMMGMRGVGMGIGPPRNITSSFAGGVPSDSHMKGFNVEAPGENGYGHVGYVALDLMDGMGHDGGIGNFPPPPTRAGHHNYPPYSQGRNDPYFLI